MTAPTDTPTLTQQVDWLQTQIHHMRKTMSKSVSKGYKRQADLDHKEACAAAVLDTITRQRDEEFARQHQENPHG